jgi:hypothetical protein
MSFSEKLGASYEQVKDQAKLKKINISIGDVSFNLKVRIPLKKEMENMIETISNPSQDKIDQIFVTLSEPIKKSIETGGEEFLKAINSEKETIKLINDDIIIDGNSIKQIANLTAIWESKVEQYFHLLESETGEPINETFEEISNEFPEQVIKQIVEDIENSIKPNYNTAKKN